MGKDEIKANKQAAFDAGWMHGITNQRWWWCTRNSFIYFRNISLHFSLTERNGVIDGNNLSLWKPSLFKSRLPSRKISSFVHFLDQRLQSDWKSNLEMWELSRSLYFFLIFRKGLWNQPKCKVVDRLASKLNSILLGLPAQEENVIFDFTRRSASCFCFAETTSFILFSDSRSVASTDRVCNPLKNTKTFHLRCQALLCVKRDSDWFPEKKFRPFFLETPLGRKWRGVWATWRSAPPARWPECTTSCSTYPWLTCWPQSSPCSASSSGPSPARSSTVATSSAKSSKSCKWLDLIWGNWGLELEKVGPAGLLGEARIKSFTPPCYPGWKLVMLSFGLKKECGNLTGRHWIYVLSMPPGIFR